MRIAAARAKPSATWASSVDAGSRSRCTATTRKTRPTVWANRGGAGSSSSVGGAQARADERAEQPRLRRALDAADGADREQHGLERGQREADVRRGQERGRDDDHREAGDEARTARVDAGGACAWSG